MTIILSRRRIIVIRGEYGVPPGNFFRRDSIPKVDLDGRPVI
jgi:hypothetical protein